MLRTNYIFLKSVACAQQILDFAAQIIASNKPFVAQEGCSAPGVSRKEVQKVLRRQ